MSLTALAAGVLNTWKRFAVSAISPVFLNITMILSAWLGAPLFARWGLQPIYALCIGVMSGGILQLGVQLLALHRIQMLPRIGLGMQAMRQALADPHTRRIGALMPPAILGVSVAQISLLINTQIASHLAAGSVSWLSYADRLMEFPTALLGVALGVVLTPQLAAAKAAGDSQRYSAMLDWGLRIVVLLAVPSAVALLTFATPLVATLFHHGALLDSDVSKIAIALVGYGAGLLGLVAIKVLAPGYYASQDIRTPVKIAMVVLVITQLLNVALVPFMAHAGLALSIGLGALVNALWLLVGLLRRGSYRPQPGWARFALQVVAASTLLAVLLLWAAQYFPWLEMRSRSGQRAGLLALVLCASVVLYFGALWAAGLKLRQMLRR